MDLVDGFAFFFSPGGRTAALWTPGVGVPEGWGGGVGESFLHPLCIISVFDLCFSCFGQHTRQRGGRGRRGGEGLSVDKLADEKSGAPRHKGTWSGGGEGIMIQVEFWLTTVAIEPNQQHICNEAKSTKYILYYRGVELN